MAREASRVGAAREPLPWPAAGRCCSSCLEATQCTLRSLLRQGQAPGAYGLVVLLRSSLDTRSLHVAAQRKQENQKLQRPAA
jgi:hypothetical protein